MQPMFKAFFIAVPLLSILLFHKKSKSFDLKLGLNYQEKSLKTKLKNKEKLNEKTMPFRVILN